MEPEASGTGRSEIYRTGTDMRAGLLPGRQAITAI